MTTKWTLGFLAALCVAQPATGQAQRQGLPACGEAPFIREINTLGQKGEWMPEREFELRPKIFPLVEISRFHPGCPPTGEQARRAREFVRRAYRAAVRNGWLDFERARADGFEPYKHHQEDETHFVHLEHSLDDRILDPERPEYLMYYDHPEGGGKLLVGMMFFVRTLGESGPQFGGPLTVWHFHQYRQRGCLHRMQMSSPRRTPDGPICDQGELVGTRSPEMLHVWFVDHLDGPYATSMTLSPEILARGIREDLMGDAPPRGRPEAFGPDSGRPRGPG